MAPLLSARIRKAKGKKSGDEAHAQSSGLSSSTQQFDPSRFAKKHDLSVARATLGPVLSSALDWITNYLLTHKTEILLCKANLETGAIKAQHDIVSIEDQEQNETAMPEAWHKTYTLCKSLPKYFLADFMIKQAKIPHAVIDNVDARRPTDGLRILFGWLTGLTPGTWWAPALHRRAVLVRWLMAQMKRLGDRHEKYGQVVKANGVLDLDEMVPFALVWDPPEHSWPDTFEGVADSKLPRLASVKHKWFTDAEVNTKVQI